ncbi:MAG: SRPBCC family protein [Planctomycetota bacterium]|nr:SRPBCC family protein [Planctomycetota bacterium]
MKPIKVTKEIQAPLALVFQTVADIREFSKVIPHIVDVKFLTEQQSGVGTRFVETRRMNGKDECTELEVTEFVENDKIRLVADSHGTIWDTTFTVTEQNGQTTLVMVMAAKAHKLLSKLMNPLIKGMVTKAVVSDMDEVKAFCENQN